MDGENIILIGLHSTKEIRNISLYQTLRLYRIICLYNLKPSSVTINTADDFFLYHLISENKNSRQLHKIKIAGKSALYTGQLHIRCRILKSSHLVI